MGENFKKRDPKLYKNGVLKKVALLIKGGEQNYRDAYIRLRKTFNVEQIKRHFITQYMHKEYKPITDKESIFYHEVLGLDPPEEQENKKEVGMARDVFTLVMFLENHEK